MSDRTISWRIVVNDPDVKAQPGGESIDVGWRWLQVHDANGAIHHSGIVPVESLHDEIALAVSRAVKFDAACARAIERAASKT